MHKCSAVLWLIASVAACSQPAREPTESDPHAGIDSLNNRLIEVYRARDAQKYATLFTDSAAFEWPAFNTVRGRAGLEAMARGNWATLGDMDLRLVVAARRVTPDQATEFGAFEQSWRDAKGARMTEFGRYVTFLVRQPDNRWLIDRFFGFEDSTRAVPKPP